MSNGSMLTFRREVAIITNWQFLCLAKTGSPCARSRIPRNTSVEFLDSLLAFSTLAPGEGGGTEPLQEAIGSRQGRGCRGKRLSFWGHHRAMPYVPGPRDLSLPDRARQSRRDASCLVAAGFWLALSTTPAPTTLSAPSDSHPRVHLTHSAQEARSPDLSGLLPEHTISGPPALSSRGRAEQLSACHFLRPGVERDCRRRPWHRRTA